MHRGSLEDPAGFRRAGRDCSPAHAGRFGHGGSEISLFQPREGRQAFGRWARRDRAAPSKVVDPVLVVAQQDGPVLKQRPTASQLGAADNFSAMNQHLTSSRLGETGPRVQRRCAAARGQGCFDADAQQRFRKESVNLEVCVSQGRKSGAGARDGVGQLRFVPYGTATGWTSYCMDTQEPNALCIIAP